MNRRESGIDIMRCTALLFVTILHSFNHSGFYYINQEGFWVWLADSIRWLSYCCVALFLIITGYLKSVKPITWEWFWGLVPILVSYFLTCCISFPVRHFLLGDALSLKEWIIKFLDFGNYAWYVEMYIGLMLLAPAVNMVFEQVKDTRHLFLAAGLMVFVTALPSVTPYPIIPDYWVDLYPLTYYVIGAVIRRLQPNVGIRKGLCVVVLLTLALGSVSVLMTDGVFDDSLQYNSGLWITCLSTAIFVTLYQVKPRNGIQKIAAWMAGGCFEGYLLSRLLDVWVYDLVPQWHSPEKYPLLWLFVTLPVFLISVTMGRATHMVTVLLMKPITKFRKCMFKEKLRTNKLK